MTTTVPEVISARTLVIFSALPKAPGWVEIVAGESDYDCDGSRLVHWRKIIELGTVSLTVEQSLRCEADGSTRVSPAYFDPYDDGACGYGADGCEALARGLIEASLLIREADRAAIALKVGPA